MSTDGAAEFDAIARRLDAVPQTAVPKARQAMKKALNDISRGAAERAPVDTGFLKSSMRTGTEGNGAYARGWVGPIANYGIYVEQGTSQNRAQPFLRPATDAVLPGYEQALEQIGREVI